MKVAAPRAEETCHFVCSLASCGPEPGEAQAGARQAGVRTRDPRTAAARGQRGQHRSAGPSAPGPGATWGSKIKIRREISNRLRREPPAWAGKRGRPGRAARPGGLGAGVGGPGVREECTPGGRTPQPRCVAEVTAIFADKPFRLLQDVIF